MIASTSLAAEQRELSGEDSQITWECTGQLALLHDRNVCSNPKGGPFGVRGKASSCNTTEIVQRRPVKCVFET